MSNPTYVDVQDNQEIPTNFPMVTFCNMKPMNFSSPLVQTYLYLSWNVWSIPVNPENGYERWNVTSLYEWSLAESVLPMRLLKSDPFSIITNTNR